MVTKKDKNTSGILSNKGILWKRLKLPQAEKNQEFCQNRTMQRYFLYLVVLVTVSVSSFAQDERYLRKMLSGGLIPKSEIKSDLSKEKAHWSVKSPLYKKDINGDLIPEYFFVQKRDGMTFFHFLDHYKRELAAIQLNAVGSNSEIYQVNVRDLSDDVVVFVLSFFEGSTSYLEHLATSRLYFMTVVKGDLTNVKISKGPVIHEEYQDGQKHYHRRKFDWGLYDYNRDGQKEIFVKYHNISRVYFYQEPGHMVELK